MSWTWDAVPVAGPGLKSRLLNLGLYYGGWLAVVLTVAAARPLHAALYGLAFLVAHMMLARDLPGELSLVLMVGALGLTVDSLGQALGFLVFPGGRPVGWLAPPWIAVLWMQLAATLHFGMGWVRRHPGPAAALGAVSGPLAFRAGEALGAVAFRPERWQSYLWLAAVWGAAFPLVALLARRQERRAGAGRYRLLDPEMLSDAPGGDGGQGKKALVRRT